MRDSDVHTLAGAYALHALPEEETRFFEAHLAFCAACKDELDGLRATAARLGTAVAQPAPPELRLRVFPEIDVTRQEPPLLAQTRERRPRWSGLRTGLAAVAAAIVAIAVGLGAAVSSLKARFDELEVRAAGVYSVLAAEDTRSVRLSGADGASAHMVISEREGEAVFLAENLPEPGEDRVYELWLIGDAVRPVGLFRPNLRGVVVEVVAADLTNIRAFGLTIEPRGGSPQPTSDPLLYGNILKEFADSR